MTEQPDGLVCMVVDVPGETREQFEAVMTHLAASGPVPPTEARLLVSGERDGGWQTVSVWESEDAMDRFFAPPLIMLAAARGLRQAVADRPGAQPPGIVLLGQYKCVLSFDETPQASYPYALHLSVGNTVVPGHLPSYALHWLVSLFFTPGEVPLLLAQPGQTVPVVHYYLPAYEPDLNPC